MTSNNVYHRLERLFLQNYEKWFLIAYTYVKNKVDAEEIVHQVCYKVLDRNKKSIIENLDGYIVVAIKNSCLKKMEKQRLIDELDVTELPGIYSDGVENYSTLYGQRKEKLTLAISELPSSSREIFKLCVIEQKKYEAVATTMNLSINTVKYHVKKCYKILRLKLIE